MSVGGYFSEFECMSDAIDHLESRSDKLGDIELFRISMNQFGEGSFGLSVAPDRAPIGDKMALCTGDNLCGKFESRSDMGRKLNELVEELKRRNYKMKCSGIV